MYRIVLRMKIPRSSIVCVPKVAKRTYILQATFGTQRKEDRDILIPRCIELYCAWKYRGLLSSVYQKLSEEPIYLKQVLVHSGKEDRDIFIRTHTHMRNCNVHTSCTRIRYIPCMKISRASSSVYQKLPKEPIYFKQLLVHRGKKTAIFSYLDVSNCIAHENTAVFYRLCTKSCLKNLYTWSKFWYTVEKKTVIFSYVHTLTCEIAMYIQVSKFVSWFQSVHCKPNLPKTTTTNCNVHTSWSVCKLVCGTQTTTTNCNIYASW
jgi:hypothetical protein